MKPASSFLLDVLLFLSASLVMLASGALLYGTLGEQLLLPKPLPTLENTSLTVSKKARPHASLQEGYDAAGLVIAEGYDIVKTTCTACHSAKLVTQNRASRAGWEEMIRWMQAKQGLWDLGAQEEPILNYLATHYGITEQAGRRAPLEDIEWYILELK